MDPAQNLTPPDDGESNPNVTVYRGPELIRKLKEVRGVAYYSGHKNTPTHKLMQKVSSSVSRIKESDGGSDPEQMKKMIKVAVIGIILVVLVLNI